MNHRIVTGRTADESALLHDKEMNERRYSVYIMASRSRNLYIGVTDSIVRRVREHKTHSLAGFTDETYPYIRTAIAREKQLKGWVREKKLRLIEETDPTWRDLSEDWEKPIVPLLAESRSFDSGAQKLRTSA